LKDNQKELVSNCSDIVQFSKPLEEYIENDSGRNRIEKRIVRAYKDDGFIVDEQWQNNIKRVYHVQRIIQKMNTKTKEYETSNEYSFYLSNKEFSAKQAHGLIRSHWLIENSNHYVRDVSMLEDFSRIRINPDNIARIRSFALNIMRKNNVKNIKGEMYKNSLCFNKLYSYQHFI